MHDHTCTCRIHQNKTFGKTYHHKKTGIHAVSHSELKSADIVSFSSRMIAAARAIESEESDALFVDPFAKALAGIFTFQNSTFEYSRSLSVKR